MKTKAKAIVEKIKVAELMMEASFIKKRRDAEYLTGSLMVEEELAKVQGEQKFMKKKKNKHSIANDAHTH